jgi:lipoate-protein ligase A
VTSDLLETYRWIGAALLRGLNSLGAGAALVPVMAADGPTPAFCFARTGRYEIEVAGRKLVGSAQRRQGPCFLQHGSVLLGVDGSRLRTVFPTTLDPLSTMTTLEHALGGRPRWQDVADALAAAFEAEHDLTLKPDGLTPDEMARVEELVRERYATDRWLAGMP